MLSIRRCVCLGLFLTAAGLSAVAARRRVLQPVSPGSWCPNSQVRPCQTRRSPSMAGARPPRRTGQGRLRVNAPTGEIILVVKAPGFLDLRTAGIAVRAGETTQITVDLKPTPNCWSTCR